MAERVGFEPTVRVTVRLISKRTLDAQPIAIQLLGFSVSSHFATFA